MSTDLHVKDQLKRYCIDGYIFTIIAIKDELNRLTNESIL